MKLSLLGILFVVLLPLSTYAFAPPSPIRSKTMMPRVETSLSMHGKSQNGDVQLETLDAVADVESSAVSSPLQRFTTSVLIGASLLFHLAFGGMMAFAPPAMADSSRLVGEIQGSGLIFKDTLEIESFDDPKIKGVTLYVSNFQRPLTERLQKDFFSDPSYASVSCVKTSPKVEVADNIATGKGGEEVFEESKSLLFKTLRIQRIYDVDKKTVVYVSFNTRLDKNSDNNKSRFKSSICALSLE